MNAGHEYREEITATADGVAVIDHLTGRYPHSSSGEWTARIEEGRVRVDGGRISPSWRLRAGEILTWRRPPWQEPAAPVSYALVHRDPHLLAVIKPAGLPTLPGGGFLENTLLSVVRRRFPEAAPAHRLGRWTSGLVLFGRTEECRASLAAGWPHVEKTYRTIASGDPAEDEFEIRAPIGPVPYPPLGTLHAASECGKPAVSRVRVVERFGDRFLADVEIETGRPHQIRIHLAAAGHPLVGDPLYAVGGCPAAGCTALPGDAGYRLHAMRLRLKHPVTGETLTLESPSVSGRGT